MHERPKVHVCPSKDSEHFRLLEKCLPYSLPLLRRLQYDSQPADAIIASTVDVAIGSSIPEYFAMGFLDLMSPDVRVWCFSSLDMLDGVDPASAAYKEYEHAAITCLLAVFSSFKRKWQDLGSPDDKKITLVSSVKANVADALRRDARFNAVRDDLHGPGGPYGKYVFYRSKIVGKTSEAVPSALCLDRITPFDYQLIIDNNDLVRGVYDLEGRPSACLRDTNDQKLKGWAFLGPDGSTRTLHVMPDSRSQGVGTMVASKTVIDGHDRFGPPQDDLAHADIAVTNTGSIRLFAKLGAKYAWDCYWMRVDLSRIEGPSTTNGR